MKLSQQYFRLALLTLGLLGLTTRARAEALPSVIPLPAKMTAVPGEFSLTSKTRIVAMDGTQESAHYLADQLKKSTGYRLAVVGHARPSRSGEILIGLSPVNPNLGPEGYELSVTPDGVAIHGKDLAGAFYGVQTLLQFLPPEVFATNVQTGETWAAPGVQIVDEPRFHWRGVMLDVGRHFFSKQEVENLLEVMAQQKLNTFHWHLVDDQGWRIQIKKYPRLTEVGAWRDGVGFRLDPKSTTAYGPDGRYGGYYTQADIREVVACATKLHITIVPEIEMPGHSISALAAYPQYSCTGGPYSIDPKGGVFHGVYCAGNDDTFVFLENVLTEVFALFPGKYVHIGGDEVPKDNWVACAKCQARIKAEGLKNEHELQSYFIRRIEKIVAAHGRNLIGWSEIREGGLAPSAAVMDWIGGAVEAASGGHQVVMSPTSNCYFDFYQSTNKAAEPKAIGGYLPLSQVYEFEPIPTQLPSEFERQIMGGQANIWTEYIASYHQVQFMLMPRICAMSEVLWSPKTARDWAGFTARLPMEERRLDAQGTVYRQAANE